ncbi:hypothetical protein V2A84_03710 [Yersinia sp. 2553 StPb PI]|uniref:hypothetical protein n=1 Tax=Yersinia sp. 2553 StPb PI TaxID=3117411 RepID=UPI003FA43884
MYNRGGPFRRLKQAGIGLREGYQLAVTQVQPCTCIHGSITGGAGVKPSKHEPHNETVLLYCARCIWRIVNIREWGLAYFQQLNHGDNQHVRQVSPVSRPAGRFSFIAWR